MNRFIIVASIFCLLMSSCNSEPKIVGQVQDASFKKVYLYKITNSYYRPYAVIDSANVINGKFEIGIAGLQAQLCFLGNAKEKKGEKIFVQPTSIKVIEGRAGNGDLTWHVEGSELHKMYTNYFNKWNQIKETKKVDSLNNLFYAAREEDNREEMARIKKLTGSIIDSNRLKAEAFVLKTVEDNLDNALGMYLHYSHIFRRKEYHTKESILEAKNRYNSFGLAAKETPYVKEMEATLERYSKCAVGQIAPEIVGQDTTGREIKLSNFRGKYVLVDFWSSGCKYCRWETPNFKKALDKYKNKNFTILGVSSDWKKESWIKAIHEDESYWPHMLLDKDNIKDLMNAYCIKGIPHIILVDPEGRILEKDLRLEQIHKAPAKYLN